MTESKKRVGKRNGVRAGMRLACVVIAAAMLAAAGCGSRGADTGAQNAAGNASGETGAQNAATGNTEAGNALPESETKAAAAEITAEESMAAAANTTAGSSDGSVWEAETVPETVKEAAVQAPEYEIAAEMAVPSATQDSSSASLSRTYRDAYGEVDFNTEEYNYISENGFRIVRDEPLSTFSVDVDTASYTNIRRFLRNGEDIPADAVRIEEMLNYFDYDYPEPSGTDPFSVTVEYADCPWNSEHRLLMIGLKAEEIDFQERPRSNLVFLLDVSGSMYSADKLPLVQKAFTMLAENLNEDDRVSIVTYAGYESVVLDGVSGRETAKIAAAIDDLEAGGSTAGAAGIEKAYALAEKNFIPGGNNRVILATDGDLNVGISSEGELVRLIQEKRKSGVHLSVLGVGTGNLKDNKMEALADNGDGNYNYIDSIFEAKKVLVDEMGGTLVTVAKDVKIQVEFNPAYVGGYRLIGYENRLLNNEDFADDTVDAGEIGAGHTVTALYEIILPGDIAVAEEQNLRYQQKREAGFGDADDDGGVSSTELLTVSIRYKEPDGDTSRLLQYPIESAVYRRQPSENLAFAAAVAEFGMLLRESEYKGTSSYDSVLALAEPCVHPDSDDYRKEFLQLVETAKQREE